MNRLRYRLWHAWQHHVRHRDWFFHADPGTNFDFTWVRGYTDTRTGAIHITQTGTNDPDWVPTSGQCR